MCLIEKNKNAEIGELPAGLQRTQEEFNEILEERNNIAAERDDLRERIEVLDTLRERIEALTKNQRNTEKYMIQEESAKSPQVVPFVARVHKVSTRKGYYILRMTIPKEIGEKIGVADKEFLFLLAQKAEWYHMLDWTQMPVTFAGLPAEIQKSLEANELGPQKKD